MRIKIFSLVSVFLMIFMYGKSQAVKISTVDAKVSSQAADTKVSSHAADGSAIDASKIGTDGIHLPPPEKGGGRPFMELLNERKSTRKFSERELEPHILSNLLWAANGVNREDDGKRTAPSARDMREIDIYIITPKGAYLFIPEKHQMRLITDGDFRKEAAGRSEFAAKAPVILVFVANAKKMEKLDASTKDVYAHIDCGYVSQNVYLYCASENLSTVAVGGVDKVAMAKVLRLKEDKVILSQPVGHMD